MCRFLGVPQDGTAGHGIVSAAFCKGVRCVREHRGTLTGLMCTGSMGSGLALRISGLDLGCGAPSWVFANGLVVWGTAVGSVGSSSSQGTSLKAGLAGRGLVGCPEITWLPLGPPWSCPPGALLRCPPCPTLPPFLRVCCAQVTSYLVQHHQACWSTHRC